MASSLSNLVNNSIIFLKEFIKLNVNTDTMIKKRKTFGVKYEVCDCFLEYTNSKDDLTKYKLVCWNKNYQQIFGENL